MSHHHQQQPYWIHPTRYPSSSSSDATSMPPAQVYSPPLPLYTPQQTFMAQHHGMQHLRPPQHMQAIDTLPPTRSYLTEQRVEEQLRMDVAQMIEQLKPLLSRFTPQEMLLMYGLYKQFTVGNYTKGILGFTVSPKELAKRAAWEKQRGKSANNAMAEYVEQGRRLYAKYKNV